MHVVHVKFQSHFHEIFVRPGEHGGGFQIHLSGLEFAIIALLRRVDRAHRLGNTFYFLGFNYEGGSDNLGGTVSNEQESRAYETETAGSKGHRTQKKPSTSQFYSMAPHWGRDPSPDPGEMEKCPKNVRDAARPCVSVQNTSVAPVEL
jgi:hypothetical protein